MLSDWLNLVLGAWSDRRQCGRTPEKIVIHPQAFNALGFSPETEPKLFGMAIELDHERLGWWGFVLLP